MKKILFTSLALAAIAVATSACAEESSTNLEQNSGDQNPRFRMNMAGTSEKTTTSTMPKFTWEEITKNGPASGLDPKIGKGSGVKHYNFKDGMKQPEVEL